MSRWLDIATPHLLFGLVGLMVFLGLVMVYSSSAFYDYRIHTRTHWEKAVKTAVEQATAPTNVETQTHPAELLTELREKDAARRRSMLKTFVRQIIWVVIGFVCLGLTVFVDYPIWGKRIGWILIVIFLLQLTLFVLPPNTDWPLQSRLINGQRSWLQVGGFRIQPSETAKLGMIMFFAWFLARRVERDESGLKHYLKALPVIGLSLGMILCESDKGVAVHICIAILALWLITVGRLSQVLLVGSGISAVLGMVIINHPEAMRRLRTYWELVTGQGGDFQLHQSIAAFRRGGLLGVGLGNSDASMSHLYAAHTDFILAVIGEEMGFVITSVTVLAYFVLVCMGFRVARNTSDPFGAMLALGITLLIGTQAFLNAAVVTGLIPTTGFTLPFLSYGGSSLVWTMISVGILINISLSTHHQLVGGHKQPKTLLFGAGGVRS